MFMFFENLDYSILSFTAQAILHLMVILLTHVQVHVYVRKMYKYKYKLPRGSSVDIDCDHSDHSTTCPILLRQLSKMVLIRCVIMGMESCRGGVVQSALVASTMKRSWGRCQSNR